MARLSDALGFVIVFNRDVPWLWWTGEKGSLLHSHGRPALEAEIRMWKLLLNEPYVAWSHHDRPVSRTNGVENLAIEREEGNGEQGDN